ncbi:hypothetical protein [Methylobacterium hispanicum]|uniref:hypothetical protein n=1 Tax=Methylobacterium hispanicum TaxID=270350 RepID=UPI002F358EF4
MDSICLRSQATNPGNLLNVDIELFEACSVFRGVRVQGFDPKAAKFFEEKVDIDTSGVTGDPWALLRDKRSDKDDAEARGEGRKTEAERDKGRRHGRNRHRTAGPRRGHLHRVRHAPTDRRHLPDRERDAHATSGPSGCATTKLKSKQPDDKAGTGSHKAGRTSQGCPWRLPPPGSRLPSATSSSGAVTTSQP